MKKLIKILLIFIIVFCSTGYVMPTLAQISITNIKVYDMENGKAKLKWDTPNEPTRALIYWGENPDDLARYNSYALYDQRHEVFLYGLQKDITYYFKIVAINQGQQRTESFLQTFSTKEMKDTILPRFLDKDILQRTKNAVAISWTTDEQTKAEIHYGTHSYDLNKRAGYGDFRKKHDLFLYNLDTDQTYYIKIIAEDRARNKKTKVFSFRTGVYLDDKTDLDIYDIQPREADPKLIQAEQVTLKWKTNLVAKSKLHYGLESGRYDNHIDVFKDEHRLEHAITLSDLEPQTTYYYKIEAYDSLYRKRKETDEMTFTTAPYSTISPPDSVIDQPREYFDTDADGLSDAYELEIGTDPFKWDSDQDGYDDGNEMRHGYDPLIPGSGQETKLHASRYFKPRLPENIAQPKRVELAKQLRQQFGQDFWTTNQNWRILTNAYIYGKYPLASIVQAVKYGGKTVHPTIQWSAWQRTAQYQEYINR